MPLNVSHVIAVYSPIVPYLEKHKVKNYSLIYNVVALEAKKYYTTLQEKKLNLLALEGKLFYKKTLLILLKP